MMVVSPPRPGEPSIPKYEVKCDNGHVLRVKAKYLGTQIRCPQCQGLAWVTTDRLLCHTLQAPTPTVAPVPMPRRQLPLPPVVKAPVVTEASPVVTPVVATLQDIPIAEVDETADLPVAIADDDDDEANDGKLTKAERRSMTLVHQGLGFFLGSIVGYCSIQMVAAILSFLLLLIGQGISTMDGFRGLQTVAEVIGWIVFVALVLNTMLYISGNILTLFTPFITGATLWFIMGLVLALGFIGFQGYLAYQAGWEYAPQSLNGGLVLLASKLYYFVSAALLFFMWLFMMIGQWQLGKFARKPMTRQRVMILCLVGLGCWVVVFGFPAVIELIKPSSKVAMWVIFVFRLLMILGAGVALIFQHLRVVNEVRNVMMRKR